MRRVGLLFVLAFSVSMFANAQIDTFRVVQLNAENFFDAIHDEGKDDYEFLPSSSRKWTWRKYWNKMSNLSKEIIALSTDRAPSLVALCEIENDSVMRDLTLRSILRFTGYRYLMTHSNDSRGIDVALLYQPDAFLPLSYRSVRVVFSRFPGESTRDILHVAGRVKTGDTLDVFVCHFPSRAGGHRATDSRRKAASAALRCAVDSLLSLRAKSRILIVGDFNDEPHSPSISEVLGAMPPTNAPKANALYNLSYKLTPIAGVEGTYKYRGSWSQLDQAIVSGELLIANNAFRVVRESCRIAALPFLLKPDETYGGCKPKRTGWSGRSDRFSDHLPLVVDFVCDFGEN